MFSNIPRPIVTILGDVVWRPEIFSNDPSPIVTPGDRLAVPIAGEQPETLATKREARATNEDLAIEWLAAKPDLITVKRDDYKAECMERFGISGRAYQFRVWPAARQLRGLTKRARPGPKKQIKN